MKRSETFSAIAPALVAALGKIEGAAKKKTNPAFKSAYANLEAVIDASRDILTEHGLTVVQMPGEVANGSMTLDTMIVHTSGEWIEGSFQIPFGKVDPQGAGSAISYARRYALMAALNMPAVDDDGNAAMKEPANAPAFITEDQAATIQALIEDVGADTAKFLAYLKVPAIARIPAALYENAVAKLNQKRAA